MLFSLICIRNNNEFSCLHIDQEGKPVNTEDRYIVVEDNIFELWFSTKGNIIVNIDHLNKKFHIGITYFPAKQGIIINKYCIGKIKIMIYSLLKAFI